MYIPGSTDWFKEKAKDAKHQKFISNIEDLREAFYERFSPEMLEDMSGKDLLLKVFDNDSNSMMYLLKHDKDYRNFGASSTFPYMSILYRGADGVWTYNDKNNNIKLFEDEAIEKAIYIRDSIIKSVKAIESTNLNSIEGYAELEKKLSAIAPIYSYVTILKYFQMIFPYYFPGMYSDKTLVRCIQILGLPLPGKSKRIANMGVISLFIRQCDINNIMFNHIYAYEWGWEKPCESCQNAVNNQSMPLFVSGDNDLSYYSLDGRTKLTKIAEKIESDVSELGIEGKEKEAIVKVRVNQGEYRERLLKKYNKCCLCGVSDPAFLVASHIKPWSACEPSERLDANNGFLLCPNHDKLFDRGYISFDDKGKIIISSKLAESECIFMNVNPNMGIELSGKNREYLEYHRSSIFEE